MSVVATTSPLRLATSASTSGNSVPYGQSEVKPTKKGIALRLREWDEMKRVVDAINDAFPALATALPCYMLSDHLTSFDCKDCYPHL